MRPSAVLSFRSAAVTPYDARYPSTERGTCPRVLAGHARQPRFRYNLEDKENPRCSAMHLYTPPDPILSVRRTDRVCSPRLNGREGLCSAKRHAPCLLRPRLLMDPCNFLAASRARKSRDKIERRTLDFSYREREREKSRVLLHQDGRG